MIAGRTCTTTSVVGPLLYCKPENLAPESLIQGQKGEIMTVKEWAKKISGFEYPADELDNLNKEMAADGIIIAHGASDDLLEFRGVIYDEVGAWEGTEVRISSRGKGTAFIFDEEENQDSFEFNQKEIVAMQQVKAIWSPRCRDVEDNESGEAFASWLIETEIPHETFDIMEDGELFCWGVVLHVDNIKKVK
jgi:hypothetical protein